MQTFPAPGPAKPAPRFLAYYRVSTGRQARSGLGLEAQRTVVEGHVARERGILVGEVRALHLGPHA